VVIRPPEVLIVTSHLKGNEQIASHFWIGQLAVESSSEFIFHS